jgi:molybdopterin-guanine dinucleotide biosynthesis protein A
MELGGRPLWKRQLELLRALGPEKIFISARTQPAWLPNNAELLLDDPPSRGPLSGLAKALVTLRTTHLIALAVDMPFMTADELRKLMERTSEDRGVVPVVGDRAEPLAAIYPAAAAADFQGALAGPDFSLQSLVSKLAAAAKIKLWPVANEAVHLYRSVNEPSDVKEGRFPTSQSSDGPATAG